MRVILLFFVILFSLNSQAHALCAGRYYCPNTNIYLASTGIISNKIIKNLQSTYKGRVISIKSSPNGKNIVKILTKNNEIIILIVGRKGKVFKVFK